MTLAIALFIAACFLAYANGANDNFKGVATLFGSNTANYKLALGWATLTTFAGSIVAVYLAQTLIKRFSGRGLVPDDIAIAPAFLLAVALGAGLTVILATITGFPISTTHSITGALFGGGLAAAGRQVNFAELGSAFFLPLLVSPLLAIAIGGLVYTILHRLKQRLGITQQMCICVGETRQLIPLSALRSDPLPAGVTTLDLTVDSIENCTMRYTGSVLGIELQKVLDTAHYLSAGVVSFARGLNDTPKIAALLLASGALGLQLSMVSVAIAIAIGGLLSARKVAETMSQRITRMNQGQGFSANIVTGMLVIFASILGLPVSTTHISVGALFGIGLTTGNANLSVVSSVILSWVLTLPIAMIFSSGLYWLLVTAA